MPAAPEVASGMTGSQMRVPDFFIVGHPKSGTTALYEMLREHPQIFMPGLKETRFFAHELHPGLDFNTHPETLEEYLALFGPARPEQLAGEASPSYLRSQLAAARIAELQPDARIIAILREPASFLRSLHLELVQDRVEMEVDFGRALAADRLRPGLEQVDGKFARGGRRYSADRVQYVEQLRRYHEVFPSERVLVLIYDDFRADNAGTVKHVLSFLGVDDSSPIEAAEANPSVRVRSVRAYRMLHALALGEGAGWGALKRATTAVTPARPRRDGVRTLRRRVLLGQPRDADEQLMFELQRGFKGEVEALSAYLDRDLVSLWGYDRLA